jgi:hypothetical protein
MRGRHRAAAYCQVSGGSRCRCRIDMISAAFAKVTPICISAYPASRACGLAWPSARLHLRPPCAVVSWIHRDIGEDPARQPPDTRPQSRPTLQHKQTLDGAAPTLKRTRATLRRQIHVGGQRTRAPWRQRFRLRTIGAGGSYRARVDCIQDPLTGACKHLAECAIQVKDGVQGGTATTKAEGGV